MLIDLFKKGHGLCYLRDVYHLNDEQIESIRSKVYYFKQRNPMTQEEIEQLLSFLQQFDENIEVQDWMVKPQSEYEMVDDAMEIFLRETGIYPDIFDLSHLRFRCIHVSSSIDDGKSIKDKGLLKLTDLLSEPSPLSSFLYSHGIVIQPEKRVILIKGKEQSLDKTEIAIKLYSTNSAIEAFIAGEIDTLKNYSCIEDAPECLREISRFVYGDEDVLINDWALKKKKLLYTSFEVSFDECANITGMTRLNTPDNFKRLMPFCRKRYVYEQEPWNIWQNCWFIDQCLWNSCPDKELERDYMMVKTNVSIGPKRITML